MVGTSILHYKILEKLGEGGMGVVYRAEDTKLDRIVALKFLPHHIAPNEADQARFLHEAKAAAALNHPNVCSVIDIQESDGQQFIVMEYVEGATLRTKLPIQKTQDAIQYAIQIGEALHAAHTKGIVHRDVKSENIMLTSDGRIKVMDFGLAKLKGSLKLTKTSSTVGTLAYMAPEQLQGGEVDARSDIFSFGVVLFEMLTGHIPFHGEHEAALMYSIVNEPPDSVTKYRSDLSPDLDRIIERALEKDPADRYQHTDDLVSELRRLQKSTTRVARPETIQASAPPPAKTGGAFSLRNLILAGAAVIAAAALFVLFRPSNPTKTTASSGRKMLAVLPFENLGSADQDYFADGITEEITSRLSGLSGLGVIARSSAMQYKKTTKSIKQVAEELGVSYVLQGTIRWENAGGTSRVRVNPQLINVSDGTQIWSQPSEAVLASAFQIQSDIATQVANALNLTLLQHEKQSLEEKLTENSEAYDAYLRGNEYALRSSDERDQRIAEQLLTQAVTLDPNFAEAYAQLGMTHADMYWEFYDRTKERQQKSKQAAERALALKPNLPYAHSAMGFYYYHCQLDYENATREFTIALQSRPDDITVLVGLGSVCRRQGRFEDALTYFKKACGVDPRSANWQDETGNTLNLMRRYGEAEPYFSQAIALSPDLADAYSDKSLMYLLEGNTARAQEVLNEAAQRKVGSENPYIVRYTLIALSCEGRFSEALQYVRHLDVKTLSPQNFYYPIDLLLASTYGYLGESQPEKAHYDEARKILERELSAHPDDTRMMSSLGIAYAGLGRKDEAVKLGKRAAELLPVTREALIGTNRLEDLALIYTMVGNQEAAVQTLEQLISVPSWMSVSLIRLDPAWKPLRQNPQFVALLSKAVAEK